MTSVYSVVSFVGEEVNHFKQFDSTQVYFRYSFSTLLMITIIAQKSDRIKSNVN